MVGWVEVEVEVTWVEEVVECICGVEVAWEAEECTWEAEGWEEAE